LYSAFNGFLVFQQTLSKSTDVKISGFVSGLNSIGCLILGTVALADDYPHLWNSALSGNNILSGGAAKLEGSVIVLIINSVLMLLMAYFSFGNKNFKIPKNKNAIPR